MDTEHLATTTPREEPDYSHVLLVEDDLDDVIMTREQLAEAEGIIFRMDHADCLETAIDRLALCAYDVVLLDLSLPDSVGEETFTALHGHAPRVPFILLTGATDESIGIHAVKRGAQDYLIKGHITTEQLVRSIRYAIERKRTEVELRQYRGHLEELVAERTARLTTINHKLIDEVGERKLAVVRLQAAIDTLRKHDVAKSQFVSNVSHELKTPLSSITYAIDNMLKGVIGPIPDKAMTYLDMVREDCHRLSATVNDILDMGRLDAHALVLNNVRTPLAHFISKLVDSIRIQLDGQQQTISTTLPSGAGFTECDTQKMQRVILNVLQNAIKYTPSGGHIRVCLRSDDDSLLLDVIDNGIGIAKEDLDHVTDRYYRVGEHVTGTGLGLALCKEIIELHGGKVIIQSPPQDDTSGTQVTLRLPKCDPPTVVCSDDDPDALLLLRRHLEHEGYHVQTSTTGNEAMRLIENTLPDFLITDLAMPGTDGIELIAALRTRDAYREIPIIVLTGSALTTGQQELLSGFSIPVLTKPWERRALYDCMEEAIATREYHGG